MTQTVPCPYCGSHMTTEVRVMRDADAVICGATKVVLTRNEAAILHEIYIAAPATVSTAHLCAVLHSKSDDSLRVQIHNIRRKVKAMPFEIESIWGKGYRYVPAPTVPV